MERDPLPVTLCAAVDLFVQHRRPRVSPETHAIYRRLLTEWQAWRAVQGLAPALADVGVQEMRDYLRYLEYERVPRQFSNNRPADARPGLAPATIESAWKLLRTLWNFLIVEGLLTAEQETYFKRKRIPRPRVPKVPRPTYAPDTIERLLAAAAESSDPEESWRDRAIMLILLESGMRASELCGMRDEQVDVDERTAIIRGKGGAIGAVFWGDRADSAIRAYLRVRSGTAGGPFFRTLNGGRSPIGSPLTREGVRSLFRRLAGRAGVDLPSGAPVHATRHTFAHDALDAGADVSQVSQLLRHATLETTMIYVREKSSRLKAIHAQLYRRKHQATNGGRNGDH